MGFSFRTGFSKIIALQKCVPTQLFGILLCEAAFISSPAPSTYTAATLPSAFPVRSFDVPFVPENPRSLDTVTHLGWATFNTLRLSFPWAEIHGQTPGGVPAKLLGSRFLSKKNDIESKPPQQIQGLVNSLTENHPDFVVFQEVRGLSSLRHLNKVYLNSKYYPILIPGNDASGYDIGFLVRRDLPIRITVETHRHHTWSPPEMPPGTVEPLFARDVVTLVIREAGAADTDPPLAAFLGVHFKSMRPTPDDMNSNIRRNGEARGLVDIARDLERRFGSDLPILAAGDFNNAIGSPELQALFTYFQDSFDSVNPPVPLAQRATHLYFGENGYQNTKQMDAFLHNTAWAGEIVGAQVLPYFDAQGNAVILPASFTARDQMGSDHREVIVVTSTRPVQARRKTKPSTP